VYCTDLNAEEKVLVDASFEVSTGIEMNYMYRLHFRALGYFKHYQLRPLVGRN